MTSLLRDTNKIKIYTERVPDEDIEKSDPRISRRDFLKTTAKTAGATLTAGSPFLLPIVRSLARGTTKEDSIAVASEAFALVLAGEGKKNTAESAALRRKLGYPQAAERNPAYVNPVDKILDICTAMQTGEQRAHLPEGLSFHRHKNFQPIEWYVEKTKSESVKDLIKKMLESYESPSEYLGLPPELKRIYHLCANPITGYSDFLIPGSSFFKPAESEAKKFLKNRYGEEYGNFDLERVICDKPQGVVADVAGEIAQKLIADEIGKLFGLPSCSHSDTKLSIYDDMLAKRIVSTGGDVGVALLDIMIILKLAARNHVISRTSDDKYYVESTYPCFHFGDFEAAATETDPGKKASFELQTRFLQENVLDEFSFNGRWDDPNLPLTDPQTNPDVRVSNQLGMPYHELSALALLEFFPWQIVAAGVMRQQLWTREEQGPQKIGVSLKTASKLRKAEKFFRALQ